MLTQFPFEEPLAGYWRKTQPTNNNNFRQGQLTNNTICLSLFACMRRSHFYCQSTARLKYFGKKTNGFVIGSPYF
jgi:hypothetical protein